jgi:hypothetical protein
LLEAGAVPVAIAAGFMDGPDFPKANRLTPRNGA